MAEWKDRFWMLVALRSCFNSPGLFYFMKSKKKKKKNPICLNDYYLYFLMHAANYYPCLKQNLVRGSRMLQYRINVAGPWEGGHMHCRQENW